MSAGLAERSMPPSASGSDRVVMRLRLIGQMEAWTLTSESVLPAGRKTRALLAVVALSAPRPVLRGRLAELLWSRRGEEQARASLRQEIHRLLEALAPVGAEVLSITRDHLSLKPGLVWIDVEEVLRATSSRPTSLSLLDAELLDGLDGIDPGFDAWLAAERERLHDRARSLAETMLQTQADPEAIIPAAQQLLAIDRAHEGAWRALMRAHAERGERGIAIQAYERCRAVLADQLDALPSADTQRLLQEIRSGNIRRAEEAAPAASAPEPEVRSAEPRIASRGGARLGVLPLQLVGTSVEEEHLSTGLAEEITTALARFRWMFLVSSNSLARFAQEHSRDEPALRRMFGLDFLLDGTIQRAGQQLRITLRLLDLRAGSHVAWARKFDRPASDLFALQDEIAAEVVAQVDPEILLIEARRATSNAPHDPTSYDLMLRALALMNRMERAPYLKAGEYLAEAIRLEPDYAAAHAFYAYWHVFLVGQGWAERPDKALAQAEQLATRAVKLDPQDARALTIAGHVLAFLHHRAQEALQLHERALSLNPNLAMAWALSSFAAAYLGDADDAERRATRYKRLSPLDAHAYFYDNTFVFVHFLRRDYESAVVVAREINQMNPSFSAAAKHYLAVLGHLGYVQEAAVARKRLLALEPGFTVRQFLANSPFERAADRDHYAEGLRLAGIPEGDAVAA
jgi:DNA-binding SARP family transcriptional activator